MPHNVLKEYPIIFGCKIFAEQISEYICTPEIAQIQIRIIFKGQYFNICTHH